MAVVGRALFYISLALMAGWLYYYGKASGGWNTDARQLHEMPELATLTPDQRAALQRARLAGADKNPRFFLTILNNQVAETMRHLNSHRLGPSRGPKGYDRVPR